MGNTKDIPTRELLDELHTRIIDAGAVDWCDVEFMRGMIYKWRMDNYQLKHQKFAGEWKRVIDTFNFHRFVSPLDGWQCGRIFKYLPRTINSRFVFISKDYHLEWHNILSRGGRIEFGGFVKLLLNKDGLHRIPYRRIGDLFLVNRVDRAVDAYIASPKCDDITAMLETAIFYD